MEFQIVKDIVLDSLLDFLPEGVNKEKITPVTLKVVYEEMWLTNGANYDSYENCEALAHIMQSFKITQFLNYTWRRIS